ncbi:hypothetical protein [Fusobacterium mortiferum]|uniref:hypothetical protein n=1 Tax=Fusobacterium mortiferum TaxID=850 RepID=UPI00195AF52F|nr:hypothetical protein [Fusobacterium mortiferum]
MENLNHQTKEKIAQIKEMIANEVELRQIIKEKFNTKAKKNAWLDKNNHHFSYDELIYLNYSQTVEVVEVEEKREENLSPVTSLVQANNIEKLSANERLKLLLSDETLRGIQALLSGTQTSNLSNEIPIEYTKLTDIKIKNCRMSESIYNRLVEHCHKNNLTITSVLNYLIDSYLKNR